MAPFALPQRLHGQSGRMQAPATRASATKVRVCSGGWARGQWGCCGAGEWERAEAMSATAAHLAADTARVADKHARDERADA